MYVVILLSYYTNYYYYYYFYYHCYVSNIKNREIDNNKTKQAHMRTAWYNIFKRLKQLYSMH